MYFRTKFRRKSGGKKLQFLIFVFHHLYDSLKIKRDKLLNLREWKTKVHLCNITSILLREGEGERKKKGKTTYSRNKECFNAKNWPDVLALFIFLLFRFFSPLTFVFCVWLLLGFFGSNEIEAFICFSFFFFVSLLNSTFQSFSLFNLGFNSLSFRIFNHTFFFLS